MGTRATWSSRSPSSASSPASRSRWTTCSAARAISGTARATTSPWTRRPCRRTSSGFADEFVASATSTTTYESIGGPAMNRSAGPRGSHAAVRRPAAARASDPLWYKDAVIYELRVGAFQDSDGDGVGDFRGLTERLDYLRDLGITAIWLLPFYPSPLRDDGYDIADYERVHPECGTLDDFKTFLREAHRHDLRVITELVINHTSDQHPWFQRARRAAAGSKHRDFYVWSDTPERYRDARVIFKDFERSNWTWDPVAKAYYWHRFFSHQPDLNFESPDVRRALFRV